MADIAPFRGIRFDPTAVADLGAAVCPPYDVIGEAERDSFEDASPYNVVRLVLPRDEPGDPDDAAKYTRARSLLDAWRAAGVLRQDDADALYLYEQLYSVGGKGRVQRGILAAVRLEDEAGVLPHEGTYDDIVQDRLELLRATETNLDTILCVYAGQDPGAHEVIDAATSADPLERFTTPDGVEHILWAVTDPVAIDILARSVEKATVVIADGHHRWQTARRYRTERHAAEGPGPWDAQMMFLVDVTRFGPALLAIHRVVSGPTAEEAIERLRPVFRVEAAETADPQALTAALAQRRAYGRTFAMSDGTRAWWLDLADPAAERDAVPQGRSRAWSDLDVTVLHALVLERLLGGPSTTFAHDVSQAVVAAAQAGSLAFLLAPAPFEAVRAVAEAGEAMPQKSTYFVPKPATGVVMRALG